MSAVIAFLLGVVATGITLRSYSWIKERFRDYRFAATLAENKVTTVGQVLHLAIQGSPTGITVADRTGEVVLSNSRSHELGIVRERSINTQVWRVAKESFDDQETHTIDIEPRDMVPRPGTRITAIKAVVQPLTLIDDRFVIIYATDESENVRMESARRDFVANVSHELKTPVGGMALLAEALMESADDPEQVSYFGARLHKEALRMADMINELISLSKLQGAERLPDIEPTRIEDVIDEAVARNQITAENSHIHIIRGESSGVWVNADRSLLVMALANLISNAINYSSQSAPVSITEMVNGDVVSIRVTDRGIGIAPEDQERVFERFFRVDKGRSRETGGTGLGLAIVKHVMANHGGTVKLWSRLGVGSTFTLELPIHHPEPEIIDTPEEKPPMDSTLRSTVARVAGLRKEKT